MRSIARIMTHHRQPQVTTVKIASFSFFALLTALATAAVAEPLPPLTVPSGTVLTLERPQGMSVGIVWIQQARELRSRGAALDLEAWHALAEVGVQPLPWLMIAAGVGATEATIDGDDGEAGLDWRIRAEASLAEYVIARSPVLGRKQFVRFGVRSAFQGSESNTPEYDMDWRELTFEPTVSYVANLRGPDRWHPYDPTGVSIRSSLLFSRIEGSRDGRSVRENQDFGFSVGASMQFVGGVTASLDVQSFQEGSYTVAAGLAYAF